MRIFITGGRGALGSALAARLASETVEICDLPDCDLTDHAAFRERALSFRPELILHCAAWTDVDGCALDPQRAHFVNGLGTQSAALACAETGAALLYVSTNEVFDGAAREPYAEFDAPKPINAYGRSKLAGEWFASHLLMRFYIVRTSWLYAPGGRNFIHRILARAAEGLPLQVVADETAAPTSVADLADGIARLIATGRYGVYHLVNEGYCTRYELARRALDLSGYLDYPMTAIRRADYPRPSTPPEFTALANIQAAALSIRLRPWEEALAEFLAA
jgi:dTDP-4-dehydrorhamnose reductase